MPMPLFDGYWYQFTHPEYRRHARIPFLDYVLRGEEAGFSPNGLFDVTWYAATYQVALSETLDDYIAHSSTRNPHPLFDTKWYIGRYPEVMTSGLTPLAHYLVEGARKGYDPHPLFDTNFYERQVRDEPKLFEFSIIDYLVDRNKWSRSTHPLFEGSQYLQNNPDVEAHGINPLEHFIKSGYREGRDPSPLFLSKWYTNAYSESLDADTNPVIDYLEGGSYAGRNPNPLFDSEWYLLHNGDVAASKLNPLVHYVTSGWTEGRHPGPKFDSAWYQFRYPDADRSDINPLAHYLTEGRARGYLPRAPDRDTPDCDALDIPFEILRSPGSLISTEACFYVTYSANGRIHDHTVRQLRALRQAGLKVVLIVVTDGLTESLAPVADFVDGLLLRINHGWDFAAWATALAAFPDAWAARLLILTNDSLCGPTSQDSLAAVLNRIRASDRDLVALCDSYQAKHHLMSFFTAMTRSGLRHPRVRAFWNGIRSNQDKQVVINEYEIRSIERWKEDGVTIDVLFPAEVADPATLPPNPTLHGWQDLLARGFPFIKAQLLREQPHNIDVTGWQAAFSAHSGLAKEIEAYLAEDRGSAGSQRPVPSPKQRFSQPDALKTYYGATTSCRPADEVDLALEVPFAILGQDTAALPARVAVIAHIFYTEFCGDLLEQLRHMPVPADLFVSTDIEAKRLEIETALSTYKGGELTVRVFPNIGRDIAPMIVGFRDVFRNYDVFLHVHSKKSPHDDALSSWREYLLTNLIGNRDIITSILHIITARNVGIVFSQHFPAVRHLLNFGYNYQEMKNLLARCGIALSKDLVLEFPSSSFFWGRCAALEPLLALDLDWSDFPAEGGQIDGTIAHAIERSLLYIAEAAGFRWIKVAEGRNAPPSGLVTIAGVTELDVALRRVHRPLLFNRVRRPKDANLVSEIVRRQHP
ncbi:MAG: rhamnan synthesis F family protein [Nitrospiraceae bacterium]|nr:rhamnan synthesis F family protein [Nitrospiraceae bacterium]